ncbi:MAG: 2'-deoxycytidine 5'-triphosphate deaminase [Nitrospinae bacterium]|nr:2'-deoxycytidine 5'-triphosphate deaminase [Nitrospinota bacterium]
MTLLLTARFGGVHLNNVSPAGVLPAHEIERLIAEGRIIGGRPDASITHNVQPASLDLTLGPVAYRLQASFLPQSDTVNNRLTDLVMYELNLEKGAILEKGAVYLIPLNENLRLPADIRGKTNPKSSTGRLDVFTRVITDNCARFEEIAPGYFGGLYLEVVPRSFTIKVKMGQRLNQLRLVRTPEGENGGKSPDGPSGASRQITGAELLRLYESQRLLFNNDGQFIDTDFHVRSGDGLLMSVDLARSESGAIGYMAKKNSHVIDLEKISHYDADDFWETLHPPRNGRLILEPEEFYIFASKERIRIPLDCAAEMVEFDAGSGELRTHYAGFFDPGFGYGGKGEVAGTKAVLEVRPHDVPFIIEDGQILFKMKYERMSSPSAIWYGTELGSNYHDQTLRLAKQFRK